MLAGQLAPLQLLHHVAEGLLPGHDAQIVGPEPLTEVDLIRGVPVVETAKRDPLTGREVVARGQQTAELRLEDAVVVEDRVAQRELGGLVDRRRERDEVVGDLVPAVLVLVAVDGGELEAERSKPVADGEGAAEVRRRVPRVHVPDVTELTADRVALERAERAEVLL